MYSWSSPQSAETASQMLCGYIIERGHVCNGFQCLLQGSLRCLTEGNTSSFHPLEKQQIKTAKSVQSKVVVWPTAETKRHEHFVLPWYNEHTTLEISRSITVMFYYNYKKKLDVFTCNYLLYYYNCLLAEHHNTQLS